MVATVKILHSATAAAVPLAAALGGGIIAINETDEKLIYKNTAGIVKALPLGLVTKNLAAPVTIAAVEAVGISLPIAANVPKVGDVIKFTAWGLLSNTTAASTSVLRLRFGATTLIGAITASSTLTLGIVPRTNVPVLIEGNFTVLAIGATGTAIGQVQIAVNTATAIGNATAPVTAAVAINTTVANLAELTIISGAATTTWVLQGARVELQPA